MNTAERNLAAEARAVEAGHRAFRDDHLHAESGRPGMVPCMHAALAARRLEREGLAELDETGLWRDAREFVSRQPEDPFEGLPH